MSKKKQILKVVSVGLSFGATMIACLYFGYKAGAFLDEYLNTAPLFSFLGILLGVFISFKSLLSSIK